MFKYPVTTLTQEELMAKIYDAMLMGKDIYHHFDQSVSPPIGLLSIGHGNPETAEFVHILDKKTKKLPLILSIGEAVNLIKDYWSNRI